jgi:hypothetical protein
MLDSGANLQHLSTVVKMLYYLNLSRVPIHNHVFKNRDATRKSGGVSVFGLKNVGTIKNFKKNVGTIKNFVIF